MVLSHSTSEERSDGGAFVALGAVARRGPAAGDDLVRWLGTHPVVRSIPVQIREDVVQTVALSLLSRAADILERLTATNPTLCAGPIANRTVSAYVGAMLRNCARDHLRRRRSVELLVEPIDARTPEFGLEIDEIIAALDAAMASALETSTPCGRDALQQLGTLARGEVELEDLVSLATGGSDDAEARYRARDRIYKRHRRARVSLVRALGRLESQGRLDSSVASRASEAVEVVFGSRHR